jgi:hypothetical protein
MHTAKKPDLLFHGLGKPVSIPSAETLVDAAGQLLLEEMEAHMLVISEIETEARRVYGIREDIPLGSFPESLSGRVRAKMMIDSNYAKTAGKLIDLSFGKHISIGQKGWGGIAVCPEFNELVIGIELPWYQLPDGSIRPAWFQPMHSLTLVLQRTITVATPLHTSFVMGVTITSDGYVLLGKRAGGYLHGHISPVPAGAAAWSSLYDAHVAEMVQEIGVTSADVAEGPFLVGGFMNEERRIGFVFVTMLSIPLSEVLEKRWPNALDRWEHCNLMGAKLGDAHWLLLVQNAERNGWQFAPAGIAALACASGYFRKNEDVMKTVFADPLHISLPMWRDN